MDKTIKWCIYLLSLYRDKKIFRKSDERKFRAFMKSKSESSSMDAYPKRRFALKGRWYSIRLDAVTGMCVNTHTDIGNIVTWCRLTIWGLNDGGVLTLVYDVGRKVDIDGYEKFDLNQMEMDETPICNAYTVALKKSGLVETFKSLDRKRKRLSNKKERQ